MTYFTNWNHSSQVYLPQSIDCADVNECRYLIFCSKNGEIDSSQLPPCGDSLYQYALCASHQAAIWHRGLEANMNSPDPCVGQWKVTSLRSHGWLGYLHLCLNFSNVTAESHVSHLTVLVLWVDCDVHRCANSHSVKTPAKILKSHIFIILRRKI